MCFDPHDLVAGVELPHDLVAGVELPHDLVAGGQLPAAQDMRRRQLS